MGRLYDMLRPRALSSSVIETVYIVPRREDYVETVARWILESELAQESGPCTVTAPCRPPTVMEPPKPRYKTITQVAMAKRDYTQHPKAKEVERLYFEVGLRAKAVAKQLAMSPHTLKSIMKALGYHSPGGGKRYEKERRG